MPIARAAALYAGLFSALALAAVTTSGCDPASWPEARVEKERAVLDLVNAARAEGRDCASLAREPAGALAWNEELAWASRWHAEDMARGRYFAHESQDGRTPFERMEAAGYDGFPRSENIAAGDIDPGAVVEGWMGSDGHCQNIMDPEANELGVGYVDDAASEWTHYWVQSFGIR